MPQFQAFHEEFKDQVTLLGIDLRPFTGLGSHEDADVSVPRKYGVTSMPTPVFIDSSGEYLRQASRRHRPQRLGALYHAIAGGRGGGYILKPNTVTPNDTPGFTRVTLVLFQDTVH